MTEPEFAPLPGRVDPPFLADERTSLESWLDFHRATLLAKCTGLTDGQLRQRSVPPSAMSLLGLVRHLTEVEHSWFHRHLGGGELTPRYYGDDSPDGDFANIDDTGVPDVFEAYHAEVVRSRALAAEFAVDDQARTLRRGQPLNLRWIYLHLIEEYARHNGHADLLRERIDGATGE